VRTFRSIINALIAIFALAFYIVIAFHAWQYAQLHNFTVLKYAVIVSAPLVALISIKLVILLLEDW